MHILLRGQCLDRRQRLRELFITRHIPQVGPIDAKFLHEFTSERQAQTNDAARIPLDAVDVGTTKSVKREGTRHLERLPVAI